jgi:MerR family transcriptional regulator, light-induced transcriptional regulator
MQNYFSPDSHNDPKVDNVKNGDIGADWSAALKEIGAKANAHKSLREQQSEGTPSEFLNVLASVVEGQVIPRLMLAHKAALAEGADAASPEATKSKGIDPREIEEFANLTLAGSPDDIENFVVELTRAGVAIESIYLDLMAPCARLLGDYWQEDKSSFTDVTMALGCLQTLLFRLSVKQTPDEIFQQAMPKVLFVTPEGGQHSFGVRMIGELYRQAGWKAHCEINASIDLISDLVKQEHFDLLGISLSSSNQIQQTADLIEKIRPLSMNRDIKVLLGGSLIAQEPGISERIGADMFASDGKEAVVIAQKMLYELNRAN